MTEVNLMPENPEPVKAEFEPYTDEEVRAIKASMLTEAVPYLWRTIRRLIATIEAAATPPPIPHRESLRTALADDLGETHDHELPMHDTWQDVFLSQADALLSRGWTLASSPVAPQALDAAERKSLEAVLNYAIGRGDEHGSLTHEEGWAVARAVADFLTRGEVRHTSSIPKPGFRVEERHVQSGPRCCPGHRGR